MRRGEVWLINLDPTVGSEIKKTRPAVIVNDDAIGILPLRVIVPITAWQERYRTDRPTVERKISHFTRRPWGGRKARTRGLARITTDLYARAAAINWARLAILGLHHDHTGWALPET